MNFLACHDFCFQTSNSVSPLCVTEGVDFTGPDPSILTFTSGQSMGDIKCAKVNIVDDDFPQGERNFSISIGGGGGGGGGDGGGDGVRVNTNFPSISINIALDIDDCKSVVSH